MKPYLKILLTLLAVGLISQCASKAGDLGQSSVSTETQISRLDADQLGEGIDITTAGLILMQLPLGLNEISTPGSQNDSVLIVAIHGYESRGYEWVSGLKGLVDAYGSSYFYRYDWTRCPDEVARDLAQHIKHLQNATGFLRIIVFGHSYGGVVVAYSAAQLGKMPAELHVIAAPLSGFPRLLDNCQNLSYDSGDKLQYPTWHDNVRVIQHKTVHAQDGAFRDLASDPQNIDLPFFQIDSLPPTMDGHRLGHNWSVTWVLDRFLGRPHRN